MDKKILECIGERKFISLEEYEKIKYTLSEYEQQTVRTFPNAQEDRRVCYYKIPSEDLSVAYLHKISMLLKENTGHTKNIETMLFVWCVVIPIISFFILCALWNL